MKKLSAARTLAFALLVAVCCATNAAAAPPDTLTVALTGKYPPFSFYNEQGELAGFDVDVSRAIAGELDAELEIVATEWDGILAGLLAGKYDAIIGSMAVTEERAEKVNFSQPYYVSGAQLFVSEEFQDEIADIGDCAGRKLGAVLGETFEHFLRNEHPEVQVVTYKSTVDIFQDVEAGRLAGFVSDRLVGQWQILQADSAITPVGPLLYEERMAIPVRKDRLDLLQQINRSLTAMREDGRLDAIHQRWFGLSADGTPPRRLEAMDRGVIWDKLLRGFAVTLGIAAASIALGFLVAIPLGVILNRDNPLSRVLRLVVDFVRGTPVLIQLFFVYFGGPELGLTLSPVASAVLTLSVNACAYMAEVVRSGLMSVNRGQELAARALGLSRLQAFRLVIWPQAFRIAMPALMNSVVALVKDTALVSIISVAEVVREAQSIISVTFDPIRYYFIVAAMFFVVTFPLMRLALRLEQRMKARGFTHD